MNPVWKRTLSVALCAAMIAGNSMIASADTVKMEDLTVAEEQEGDLPAGTPEGDQPGETEGGEQGGSNGGDQTKPGDNGGDQGNQGNNGQGDGQTQPEEGDGNSVPMVPINPPAEVPAEELTPAAPVEETLTDEYVCKVGDAQYTSLQGAVAAILKSNAKSGTVTLLKDCEGSGIGLFNAEGHVNANLTIDFGGHTYTLSGESVGSTGTESQGFHFEKDNTVTLKNGHIQVSESASNFTMLIQNYCNLTLENVSLMGNGSTQYIISVNYGDVALNNVNIDGTNSSLVAIDVMHWLGTIYEGKAPTMAINNSEDDHINGGIAVYCYPDTGCENKPTLEITGGIFSDKEGAADHLAPGYILDENGTVIDPEEKPDNRPSTPSDDDDDDDDDRDSSSSASKPSTGDKVVTKGETTTVTTGVSSLVKDETLSAKVSESVMNDAVDTALKTAAKKGTDPVVEIQLDSSKDVEAMSVTLTTKSLEKLANTDGAQLVLRSPAASVSFDAEALQAIVAQAGTNVTLSVAPVATDKLSAAQKASVGNDLVFELLLVSNGKYVTDFKDGQATVTLPYVLRSGETAENLVVYYLDDQGVLHACDTRYDAVNQCVIFTTPHFSKYVVGQAAGASASSDKENPSTGGRSMTSALAAAALSLGGVFLLGRKKR